MPGQKSVDELLAAQSSSDEDEGLAGGSRVAQGQARNGVGGSAMWNSSQATPGSGLDQAGQAAAPRPSLTVEEALAQADLSDEEDEPAATAGAPGVVAAQPQRLFSGSAGAAAEVVGSSVVVEEEEDEDQLSDQAEDEGTSGAVGLDELLAMGSESSSDEDGGGGGGAQSARPLPKHKPDRARNTTAPSSGASRAPSGSAQMGNSGAPRGEPGPNTRRNSFAWAPIAWCLEHERELLLAGLGPDVADSAEGRVEQSAGGTSSQALTHPLVEVRPCVELRRTLAQEYDRPTCIVAHSKYVGVGTLRGAVILLDPKIQDAPSEPIVLAPPAVGEDGCAVTAAAFSTDGTSALVGHKNGQLVLWDLATQRAASILKDIHACAVLTLAFCRPSWQYALSADASGSVYFLTFTSTFGRRDCTRQLLLEQSSNIGMTLRILPAALAPQAPQQMVHPADSQCLVALCATNATVLLTLHPHAQLLQKMQYHNKDVTAHTSLVPDAAWLRLSSRDWNDNTQAQASDPQLCIAFGQTIHIMRVSFEQEPTKMKEEFKIALLHRYSWSASIQAVLAFNESVIAVLDSTSKLSIVQLPSSPADPAPQVKEPQQQQLTPVHSEDVSGWSLTYHTYTSLDGSRDARCHSGALAIFRGRSRTLYVCGMKEVSALQIGRWGQRIEELVGRGEWHGALDVFLALHKGTLPPLLDFPQAVNARQRAVDSRTTQVIQSYLASRLQQDTPRKQARQMCATAVNACIEMGLWSVLYKTVFECFKGAGHMNVYCSTLEPFIVKGKIPRGQMDSEVLSSILQSYALPLQEEEQSLQQHFAGTNVSTSDVKGSTPPKPSPTPLFLDVDHCIELFPVARRLQQLVLYVDVSQLDLNLAIRLFTQHRLWTALVHVYCALGDYVSPLELLVGECTQLTKKLPAVAEGVQAQLERPFVECILVRKLFYFLHRCFELRAFPLDPSDGPGMVHPGPGAIGELLRSIFKHGAGGQPAPPLFLRLLWLSPYGLFSALSSLYTSPSASHAVRNVPVKLADGSPCILDTVQEPLTLGGLFRAIEAAVDACRRQAKEDGAHLPAGTESELLWFVARSVPRAGLDLAAERLMEVAGHLMATQRLNTEGSPEVSEALPLGANRRSPEEAQQLLIGVLAAQEPLGHAHRDALIKEAMQKKFHGVASWLYEKHGEYDRALDCRMQDDDLREGIFEYIISQLAEQVDDPAHSKALVEATLQRLRLLVAVDAERCAVMICTQFASVADHGSVLERLRGYPQMELQYLETLLVRRRPFHWKSSEEQQAFFDAHVVRYVELLCSLARGSVLPFVIENEQLPLRECLELCRRYGVTDASVHLLERTGDFAGVLELFLGDYGKALERLHASFVECWDTNRSVLGKALKRLAASRSTKERCHGGVAEHRAATAEAPWWEGFEDAQRCVDLLERAGELSARNSNIMTDEQLEDLWFGVLRRTVEWQERAAAGRETSRQHAGLSAALAALAFQAMGGVLAYLSLPRSLKWICAEFNKSTLGVWKEPLESMLSGLIFQQGLLRAAKAVAAHDVVEPFTAVKRRGSRGVRCSPPGLIQGSNGELQIRMGTGPLSQAEGQPRDGPRAFHAGVRGGDTTTGWPPGRR